MKQKSRPQRKQKKIKETAESDIAQSTNKAKETLKEELSVLVVAGASKILNKEIDESANKEIVDQLIKEL
jgi:F-type H+-transporting ATPase subunit b